VPKEAHGKKKVVPPRKNHHMEGFDEALQDALDDAAANWGEKDFNARVTFELTGTRNPGAVPEYRVKLTEI
jgi:hypothetical protein